MRLAFCDRPPYAVYGGEYRGAWLSTISDILLARNVEVSYIHADEAGCDINPRETLMDVLHSGLADIALYPFVFNQTNGGLISAYPIENGSPIFVSERRNVAVNVFMDPIDSDGWILMSLLLAVSILAAVCIDRRGNRTRHVPRVLLAMFGSVDLPHDAGPAHWIIYIWMALLSIVIMALYTSIMAQVLLLNTVELDTFSKANADNVTVSVTYDVGEQMHLSNSPFSLALASNHRIVDERDALVNLPVLVSWPVASMMKQLSCDDLDLSYRELSKVSYSTLARPEVPAWFYGDVRDAVLTRKFAKAVQAFVLDHPFCEDKSGWGGLDARLVMPVIYLALGSLALSWSIQLGHGIYMKRVEPKRVELVAALSGRATLAMTKARSSFRCDCR